MSMCRRVPNLTPIWNRLPGKQRLYMARHFRGGDLFWIDFENFLNKMTDLEKALYNINYNPNKETV